MVVRYHVSNTSLSGTKCRLGYLSHPRLDRPIEILCPEDIVLVVVLI